MYGVFEMLHVPQLCYRCSQRIHAMYSILRLVAKDGAGGTVATPEEGAPGYS